MTPGYAVQPVMQLCINWPQQAVQSHKPCKSSCLQAAEDVTHAAKQAACPCVAVAGSKGVGKSTLARLLVNSLLNVSPAVAFLDTDCGQPELTVPGMSYSNLHVHLRDMMVMLPCSCQWCTPLTHMVHARGCA